MNWLPQDYEAPKSANLNYLKLQDGPNRMRILSAPILGWEDWKERQPVRYRMDQKPDKPFDPSKPAKHFWSMIVYNFDLKAIQIFHVTQVSVRKALESFVKNQAWGAPYYYNICVTKEGQDKETKYQVIPEPHSPIGHLIEQEFKNKPCWLDALFVNGDPFEKQYGMPTPGVFGERPVSVVPAPVSHPLATNNQLMELHDLLADCEPGYEDYLMVTLKKPPYNANRFQDVTEDVMNKVIFKTKEAREAYQSDAKKRQEAVPF